MKAQDFLRKGADLLEERGKQYDQPGGERSMGKAVKAFNAITGRDLTEPEGWLLLQVLKDVRQWQNPEKYHADSAEDCVSYAALKAEALQSDQLLRDGWTNDAIKAASFATGGPVAAGKTYIVGEQPNIEPAAAMQDDSERMAVIGQNGNGGEHYDEESAYFERQVSRHQESMFRTMPEWADSVVAGVDNTMYCHHAKSDGKGNYISGNGKKFNMNRWSVVRPQKDATQ